MRSDGAAHGCPPSSFRDRLAALEVPCVPPGPLGCKPPHRVPSALKGRSNLMDSTLPMKRGFSFTILALLCLLASIAMAVDNNWSGAAFGCIAAGCLFVMAIV
jgi:hypothetical protein